MAKLGGLREFFDAGLTLSLPVGNPDDDVEQEFTIPLASAELGAWCHLAAQAGAAMRIALSETSTDEDMQAAVARVEALPQSKPGDPTMPQRTLGTAYDEMVAAGVKDAYITFAGATAFAWILGGEEHAERYWTSGGNPKALRPTNRAERRATANTRTTSTAKAGGATSPASTSGTSTRQRSRRGGTGRRSAGTTS